MRALGSDRAERSSMRAASGADRPRCRASTSLRASFRSPSPWLRAAPIARSRRSSPDAKDGRVPPHARLSQARRPLAYGARPAAQSGTGGVSLSLPFAWSDDCLRHEPGAEIWVGVRTPATELPERALRIREALLAAGRARGRRDRARRRRPARGARSRARRVPADGVGRVGGAGLPNDRVVPYVFAREELTSGRPPKPAAVWARPGRFAYDTMTLIGPGTWEAARARGRRRADGRRPRRRTASASRTPAAARPAIT